MRIDPENPKHLIAEDGKVFRRIATGLVLGHELILGYYKDENGVYQEDVAENFDEVDEPENEGGDIEPVE